MDTLKRVVIWIVLVGVVVIALVSFGLAILGWMSSARFNQRIAAIQSTGDPLSLVELARDPIPPETNAAVFLRQAGDDLQAIDKELIDVYGSESYRSGHPDESELESIRSALEAHPEVVSLLTQAARCPDYDSQPDYTVGAQAFMAAGAGRRDNLRLRSAVRLLNARILLLQSQGKQEEALENCVLLLRLARHFEREPMLIGYLVAVACRGLGVSATNGVLRAGPLPTGSRQALEAELALHDGTEAFSWALISERALGMDNWRAIPARNWWPVRIMWDDDQVAYLDLFDQHLALAAQPYSAVVDANLAAKAPASRRAVLTQLVMPAILLARQARDRARATLRCLRVLNALQAVEQPGDAAQPKLSDLGLPAEATVDPFTGTPLKLKKLPEGWLVYSVGEDLIDDGGQFDKHRDVGVGPLRQPDAGTEEGSGPVR